MGGRGSLSSNKHRMYNAQTIKREMLKYGIKVYGTHRIPRQGLSLVVEALEELQGLEKRFGHRIDSVLIGVKRRSDFSYSPEYNVKKKDGTIVNLGRTLLIPQKTVKLGKADLEREVKYASRNNIVVAKNMRQMIMHEYGHALHLDLKKKNPQAYKDLEKDFQRLMKNKGSRINLSHYASTKAYKGGKINSHEYVAEALTHVMRNTTTRKGQDMIDTAKYYVGKLPGVSFSYHGMRQSSPKKIKRKRRK